MRTFDRSPFKEILFFVLLAIASVFCTNPYSYGLDNHFITIPFLWEKMQPELFPDDLVVNEVKYLYTCYLESLARLIESTGIQIEIVFFSLHLLFSFLTCWAFFHLARVLTGSKAIAAVSCILFLFGTKTIGYVGTMEGHLMERTMILPLELLGLSWMLQRRWIAAFAAIGIAFCFHPLSSVYLGVMIGFTGLYVLWTERKEHGVSKRMVAFLLGIMLGAICSVPALYLKFTNPQPLMPAGTPMPGWLDILALRSSYHVFPFDWPWHGWLRAAMFWIGVWLINRRVALTSKDRMVMASWFAVACMAFIGTVFSEFIPLSLPIQFQFFRSYPFAFMLGMIFLARGIVLAAHGRVPIPIAIAAIVLAVPAWGEMDPIKYGGLLLTWLVMLIAAWHGVRRLNWPLPRMVYAPMILLVILTPISVYLSGFTIYNNQDPAWVAVQRWAQSETPINAGFIVPPNHRGFRVDSHRSVFVDWNDGTQNFFNQEFGPLWLARMKMVGFNGNEEDMGKGYRSLESEDFDAIQKLMPSNSQVYAVLLDTMSSSYPRVFDSGTYQVVRIR